MASEISDVIFLPVSNKINNLREKVVDLVNSDVRNFGRFS